MSTPPSRLRPRPLAERGRAVVVIVALLILLGAVAVTAGMSRPGAGATHGYTLPPQALFGWGAAVAVATGLGLTLFGPFWSNREKWTAFVVAMLLLFGFAVLAERSSNQAQQSVQPQQVTQATAAPQSLATPTPQAQPTAHARPVPPPALHRTTSAVPPWVLAIVGAAVLLLAAAALRVAGRATGGGAGAGRAPVAADLDAAVERSMADVAAESDPRRAIVAAWLAMGDALARHGMRRHPWEAPVEYMQRALQTLRVRRESAQRLTALFQRARYSDHPATPAMRDDALAALQSVRDDLHEDAP